MLVIINFCSFLYFHLLIINCIASKGKLVGGSVLSFTDKLNTQDKEDLSNALLLAQLGADHHIKGGGDPITMEESGMIFTCLSWKI